LSAGGSVGHDLLERYDALLVDLDGVVSRGGEVVPGAPQVLDEVRRRGVDRVFLTNNSSRTREEVVAKLAGVGVEATVEEILTSALATADLLVKEGLRGAKAFVIGGRGIREALAEAGVHILDGEPERADLVVIGWDPSVDYEKLRRASLLSERGARLVATNADASYPAPDGLWPGAGAILAVVTVTTGVVPTVVGKPAKPLFERAAEITGARRPLVVGDRLDTDIAGAASLGWDSLLVLSGVSRPEDLLSAADLPTYVGSDLSTLLEDVPAARFRPAGRREATGVAALLASAGLPAAGAQERIGETVVSTTGARIDATSCLQDVGGVGILRSVAVRPELRGKGLGMLAVAAAVGEGRRRRVAEVGLFTETAEPFFERLGFRRVERKELPESIAASAHAAEECAASATPMLLRRGLG